ncbi:MAG: UDP-2,3-diacylglucosamine diphosphatase LpxI [Puniceicoccales bacterium]|jgi:DUF1009 family protein|nr:UDP-2,3-diacylglucosamine diphosphatase LpxI [Puniceicoccales bacterium]
MEFKIDDIPAGSRIALIAGRGEYPVLCARNAVAAGHKLAVIAVDDGVEASFLDEFGGNFAARISPGQIIKLLKTLKKFSAKFAIMAGQIKPKKLFHGLIPDVKAMWILAMLKERNAESIFGAIAAEIGKIGVKLLDARLFASNDLATMGPMSCRKSTVDRRSLEFGINVAREIARLNIGQSVVVGKGTVIAVEDFAGTDDMISRAGKFNLSGAIFIKTAKHGQDFRFDVPVFGMQTLENLRSAKIKYVALEANGVIILNKKNVIDKAREYATEIVGF